MALRRILRAARRRLRPSTPRPAILLYHRVVSLPHDPWALAVSPEHFDEQMRFLAKSRIPMSVNDMVEQLKQGRLPARAVGVTFDDAYRDNLIHAKPSLVRHGIPATVFVPTGYIGRTVPFWWDELAGMVLDSEVSATFTQRFGDEAVQVEWQKREDHDGDHAWRGWSEPRTRRQKAYVALWSRMQKLTEEEREPVLRDLRAKLPSSRDLLGEPMTVPELRDLTEGSLVRLGAHTVHHASLSDISVEEGRAEIRVSRAQCQELTADSVEGFAYPYGNLTPEACREVEKAGFAWACAATDGFLDRPQPHRYMLPRISMPNIAGHQMGRFLANA